MLKLDLYDINNLQIANNLFYFLKVAHTSGFKCLFYMLWYFTYDFCSHFQKGSYIILIKTLQKFEGSYVGI